MKYGVYIQQVVEKPIKYELCTMDLNGDYAKSKE